MRGSSRSTTPRGHVRNGEHLGQPLYARTIPDRDRDEWVRLEIESNPLPICTRPQVLRSARRT
ncbi:major capsid protein [Paracoccus marcusii]|uniref:major capsid protein n=1 Tax=Paracoccus marcusii TaxID=59779 RepID=UPI0039C85865